MPARTEFHSLALDGAMLLFQPSTGIHIRMADASTRRYRRQAPRVVMFGITNACDLHCAYCSRDTGRGSRWTLDSAARALEGLAAAGTLEVAFGGGEPFLFPGFERLIERLHERTALALNVTTHGGRISAESWPAYAGRFGQVRLSLHDDLRWRRCAPILTRHGQLWGANILVDAATLPGLRAQMTRLAAAGCSCSRAQAHRSGGQTPPTTFCSDASVTGSDGS